MCILFHVCELLLFHSACAQLLDQALNYAAQFRKITPEQKKIIHHAKNSILVSNDEYWTKRLQTDIFDETMGSYENCYNYLTLMNAAPYHTSTA